ncbi:hypothetical protein PanWU01x14_249080, partial [Parasponia andersonii]
MSDEASTARTSPVRAADRRKMQKMPRLLFLTEADSSHRSPRNWSPWTRLLTGNLM